ncbi:MAG TPA: hypothetical protein VGW34_13605 [Allosphingosinicella sp.]|nr:hypothetical protein [Allosphingosinicella sp.]
MANDPRTSEAGSKKGDPVQRLITIGGGIIGLWGAAVTVITGYNTARLQSLENNLSQLREERVWAKELYSQYDSIVTKKDSPEAQLARLEALLALVELTDQENVKDLWGRLIKQQAGRHRQQVTDGAQTGDRRAASLEQQFARLERAASATAAQAKPVWSNYDFDIFWCPGEGNKAAANAIAGLKTEDPGAVGNWRVRGIKRNSSIIGNKAPYSIVWDYPDEEPIADTLAKRLRALDLPHMKGTDLRILRSARVSTRWYLSVFVCR